MKSDSYRVSCLVRERPIRARRSLEERLAAGPLEDCVQLGPGPRSPLATGPVRRCRAEGGAQRGSSRTGLTSAKSRIVRITPARIRPTLSSIRRFMFALDAGTPASLPPLLTETHRYDRSRRKTSMKSRRTSPCQREGRQFESGLVLHRKRSPAKQFCLAGLFRCVT